MLSLVLLGSSALISEKLLGHCTAWMAYVCIQKILGFQWWMQCTALMPHPLQFAKNLPSGPSRRSITLQLGFQRLLVSREVDRSLSWFWHLAYKSQCNCTKPLSFWCTKTTALHHGLWLGQIVPVSNISFMCALTTSIMGGGILWNCSLKGSSSTTLFSCLARLVQPNSPGSKEKMSWYSANRAWVATWFPSDHSSRLDKSSCWKSASLLLSTNTLVCCIPWTLSRSSKVPGTNSN